MVVGAMPASMSRSSCSNLAPPSSTIHLHGFERSGLSAVTRDPVSQVAPGVVPLNQIWWALPSLLRNDDTALLGGWDWELLPQSRSTILIAAPLHSFAAPRYESWHLSLQQRA
jgi:hypothetical protein